MNFPTKACSQGSPRFWPQATSASSSTRRQAPQLWHRARLVGRRNPSILQWMFSRGRAPIVGMDAPTSREPQAVLIARLAEIQGWKTGRLREELTRLSGSPARSWNRPYLVRKVSWLTQARERQSSDGVEVPTLVREVRDVPRSPRLDALIRVLPNRGVQDPRLPRPGSVILRDYRGLRLTVTVLERGFEWNGQIYSSLTAVAKAITGTHWNGRLFFGLSRRKRDSK